MNVLALYDLPSLKYVKASSMAWRMSMTTSSLIFIIFIISCIVCIWCTLNYCYKNNVKFFETEKSFSVLIFLGLSLCSFFFMTDNDEHNVNGQEHYVADIAHPSDTYHTKSHQTSNTQPVAFYKIHKYQEQLPKEEQEYKELKNKIHSGQPTPV